MRESSIIQCRNSVDDCSSRLLTGSANSLPLNSKYANNILSTLIPTLNHAKMTDTTGDLTLQLIQTQKTLVLATADPRPWSAPVYYEYQKQRFYFFSRADSRHVSAALSSDRCAGAVFRDSDDWREIEGLQMEGSLEEVRFGAEAARVFAAYIRRFPTVKSFFDEAVFDFAQFARRFSARLYAFTPERVFYMNNQTGLGKRREVELPS